MLKFLTLFLIALVCPLECIENDTSKYWMSTCNSNCLSSLNNCLNCFGERSCKTCITTNKPECSTCADDIFNRNDLETIGGTEYMVCDTNTELHPKVCHIFCRGQFFQTGICSRIQNIPACVCSLEAPTSSSSNLTFTMKIKLSTPQYRVFYPLPSTNIVLGLSGTVIDIIESERGIRKRTLNSAYLNAFAFGVLSNGDLIVGYRTNKTLLVWNVDEFFDEPLKRVIRTDEIIQTLTVLKNNDIAIGQTSVSNFDIVIRDSQYGSVKKRLVGHQNTVWQILHKPDDFLVSCSADGTVKIWEEGSGNLYRSLPHPSDARSIAFLKNGYLASGLIDGRIYIWNVDNGVLIRILNGHTDRICAYSCLLLLNTGELLSASNDKTLRIWNPYDGSLKQIIPVHQSQISQMSYLPNGQLVTSSDTEMIIWK